MSTPESANEVTRPFTPQEMESLSELLTPEPEKPQTPEEEKVPKPWIF